jgi:hypothetical protein
MTIAFLPGTLCIVLEFLTCGMPRQGSPALSPFDMGVKSKGMMWQMPKLIGRTDHLVLFSAVL